MGIDNEAGSATSIYQLKVTLQGIEPPIWRRFEVLGDSTLAKLHDCLQVVMGWTDSHLHQFVLRGEYYGPLDAEFPRRRDEQAVRVADLLREPGDNFTYEYDFGDCWRHELMLEGIHEPKPQERYPQVLAGERACPPEDCGGVSGYEHLIEVLGEPRHREYRATRRWVGVGFDPEFFNIEAVNLTLEHAFNERPARASGNPRSMRVLNRSAIIIRARAPYIEWAAGIDSDAAEAALSLRNKVSIYLVPEDPNEEQETPPVELFFKEIFELELDAWTTDETEWPAIRDFETFCDWFEVIRESIVVDLAHGELETEEL
jgi:hypothetical protein